MLKNTHFQFVLQNNHFCLFEQKQWSIDLSTPMGTEILIRVPDPHHKTEYLSTIEWIHFAEQQPQIELLTLKIIEKLLRNAHKLDPVFAPYYINVPPPVITCAFVNQLKLRLDQAGIPYNFIGIELTERLPVLDVNAFQLGADALQILGIPLALDDYGQGYATMHFLKDLKVDRVKIDRTLLRLAKNNHTERLTLLSLLDFATEFNVEVIAEGIETETDYQFACHLKCDGLQGYHIDLPKMLIPIDG